MDVNADRVDRSNTSKSDSGPKKNGGDKNEKKKISPGGKRKNNSEGETGGLAEKLQE